MCLFWLINALQWQVQRDKKPLLLHGAHIFFFSEGSILSMKMRVNASTLLGCPYLVTFWPKLGVKLDKNKNGWAGEWFMQEKKAVFQVNLSQTVRDFPLRWWSNQSKTSFFGLVQPLMMLLVTAITTKKVKTDEYKLDLHTSHQIKILKIVGYFPYFFNIPM